MKPCLTAADARRIVRAAVAEAERNQWNVTVAVVDDGGALLALERLDGAFPQSAEIATRKAWTAAAVRLPTKTMEDMVKERPALLGFPGQVRVQGGLPILVGAECVGAVGVSGVASHQDEQVARAGVDALADETAPPPR
ncbi:MAG TPA: heme-binding protein [Kofleriaceae bacterium]|nr:heme-binding protein [Kofleriaceae bacterium]